MSDLQGPPRWLVADDEIAERLRPALRAAQGAAPSAAEHDRMWGALAAKLPLAAFQGEATQVSPLAADGGAPARSIISASAGLLRLAGTAVIAAAIGFGAAKLTTRPVESAPRASDRVATGVAAPKSSDANRLAPSASAAVRSGIQPKSEPLATSHSQPASESQGRAESQATSNSQSTPASRPSGLLRKLRSRGARSDPAGLGVAASEAAPNGMLAPAASEPSSPSTATPAPSDLAAELDLLARARRVVAESPARALQLTAEHARRFQDGVLAQEREVLAIDALSRLGQRELAATRARRFMERYPNSAHRVRLGAALRWPRE